MTVHTPIEKLDPADAKVRRELKTLLHPARGRRAAWIGACLILIVGARWLLRDGRRTLWVGVGSGNAGAQRFYARHGFEHVGDYIFPVGRVRDHEFILRRPADVPA